MSENPKKDYCQDCFIGKERCPKYMLEKYYCQKCILENGKLQNPNYFDDADDGNNKHGEEINDLVIDGLPNDIVRVITDCPCSAKRCQQRIDCCKDFGQFPTCDFMLIDNKHHIEIYIELKNTKDLRLLKHAFEEQLYQTCNLLHNKQNTVALLVKTKKKCFPIGRLKDSPMMTRYTVEFGITKNRVFLIPNKDSPDKFDCKYNPDNKNILE